MKHSGGTHGSDGSLYLTTSHLLSLMVVSGVLHLTITGNIYKGYFISKGAYLFGSLKTQKC